MLSRFIRLHLPSVRCVLLLVSGVAACAPRGGSAVEGADAGRIRTAPVPVINQDEAPPPLPATTPSTGDTVEYSVLMNGRSIGLLRQWPDTNSTTTTQYAFLKRGRGPQFTQTLKLDKAGFPIGMQLSGVNDLKVPIRELVQLSAGPLLTWRNENAAGRTTPGKGFYLPMQTLPTDLAALARSLLLARSRTVPLLPEGSARIATGASRTMTGGDQTLRVTLYEITGLGLTPLPVWLDAQGRLFASGNSEALVIRSGFESVAHEVVAAQRAAAEGRQRVLANRLARNPQNAVAIMHVNLFDAVTKQIKPRQTVVVRDGRIESVGNDGAVGIPAGAEAIDGTNRTLLPGLWDMHVRVQDEDGLLHIASGVTTVRDLANDTDELMARRARFDSNHVIGPRVLAAGLIDGPGPFAGPIKVPVTTRDEARAAVERYADAGLVQIQLNVSIDPSLVPTIVRAAHQRNLRVSGPVPQGMTAEQMVRAGADELQHANALFLEFLGDSAFDIRTLDRFTVVARRAGSVDLRSDRVERFIALLKERDVVVDPTLNVFEQLFTARQGTLDQASLPLALRLPPVARRGLLAGGLPVSSAGEEAYRTSFIALERLVRRLHDAGVRLVAGTDAAAGFSLHRELELYSEAGIPNTEILYIATLGAARVMKVDAERGSIEPGKLADLVLVDGDPSQRMRDIRRAELVMKGGVMYVPDSLYAAYGVKPAPRKGAIPAREVGAEDVVCRGAAARVPRGSKEKVPLNCRVVDPPAAEKVPVRRSAPRTRRPAAPTVSRPKAVVPSRP